MLYKLCLWDTINILTYKGCCRLVEIFSPIRVARLVEIFSPIRVARLVEIAAIVAGAIVSVFA